MVKASVNRMSYGLKDSIPWTLVMIFILFTVLLIMAGILFYSSQRDRIYHEQENSITAIATLKIGQIMQWHSERIGDATIVRDNDSFTRVIRQYLRGDIHQVLCKEIEKWMESFCATGNYRSIMLLDTSLKIRVSFSTSDSAVGKINRETVAETVRSQTIFMTDIFKEENTGHLSLDLIIPLLDPDEKKTVLDGVVILRIDPEKNLFPLIQTWPTQSRSSETLIFRKDKDSILFLNELRHRKNAAFNLRLPISTKNLLAARVLRGSVGIMEGVDYRGAPVVGFGTKVPGLSWYMVAKTDKEEIQAPVRRYFYIAVFMTILLVLTNALIFGLWMWDQRVKQYRKHLDDERAIRESEENLKLSHKRLRELTILQGKLLEPTSVEEKLNIVTRSLVDILDSDFARIWIIKKGDRCDIDCIHAKATEEQHICRYRDKCLHLISSSGRYNHTDGKEHGRVPFDCYKIGKIASGDEDRFLTNDVINDPRVHNHEWASELGLVSFAGYRLIDPNEERLGVMALFSRHELSAEDDLLLQGIADTASQVILTERMEANLRESEERFSKAYMTSPISFMIAYLDDGRIIEVNDAFTAISGFKREEVLDQTTVSLNIWVHEEDRKTMVASLKEGNAVIRREIKLRRQDGKILTALLSAQVIQMGARYCIISSIEDISERKVAEAAIIKAKEKAEESDRLKTAFLHNISHEIRTPMNAIVGFSALLGEPDLNEKLKQSYISTIMQSSDQLLSIISDIVDISNIEASLVKTVKNPIDVNLTLKSLYDQFLPRARDQKIKLDYESQLSGADALIQADSTKLTQVLSNLLNNALKFTPSGSIKVGCTKKDNFLEFSVSDTGIGITSEYHIKIFERFYQVQNTTTRMYEGTGLGLSISKAYVELMGGKIWLSSEPGKGTTFFFTVPLDRQFVAPMPVSEKMLPVGFSFTQRKTILVAEDIDSNFKLISYFLSSANTKIIRASNGKEAVEVALTDKNIDLILMDIKMPEMDGYTAVRLIREANIKTPIVAQTAYADDMEKAIMGGCNGFISKPFDRNTLLKVISEHI
jgi:PAS domain S-box-containing protein